jgi:hypothetical protein
LKNRSKTAQSLTAVDVQVSIVDLAASRTEHFKKSEALQSKLGSLTACTTTTSIGLFSDFNYNPSSWSSQAEIALSCVPHVSPLLRDVGCKISSAKIDFQIAF